MHDNILFKKSHMFNYAYTPRQSTYNYACIIIIIPALREKERVRCSKYAGRLYGALLSLKWLSTFRHSQLLTAISDDAYVTTRVSTSPWELQIYTNKSNYTPLICVQLTRVNSSLLSKTHLIVSRRRIRIEYRISWPQFKISRIFSYKIPL